MLVEDLAHSEPETHRRANISPGGITYGAEEQHKSRPFGKTAFPGVGKSTDKLHGAAWSSASKRCMSISFHPLLSLILHLYFRPGGKRAWTQQGEFFTWNKICLPCQNRSLSPSQVKSAPELPRAGEGLALR